MFRSYRADGSVPHYKLGADFEVRNRSDSAETVNDSLVIGVFRMANSTQSGLGRISG